MRNEKNPMIENAPALRFEQTERSLSIYALDARGLERLRPLADSLELLEGVRSVTLYCDRVRADFGE